MGYVLPQSPWRSVAYATICGDKGQFWSCVLICGHKITTRRRIIHQVWPFGFSKRRTEKTPFKMRCWMCGANLSPPLDAVTEERVIQLIAEGAVMKRYEAMLRRKHRLIQALVSARPTPF